MIKLVCCVLRVRVRALRALCSATRDSLQPLELSSSLRPTNTGSTIHTHTYRPCIYPYLPKSKYFTCLLIIRYSAVAGNEKAGQNSSTVWTGHRSFVYKNSRWPTQLVCCLSPLRPPCQAVCDFCGFCVSCVSCVS